MRHSHHPAAESSTICSVSMGVTFFSWKGSFYKPRGPFRHLIHLDLPVMLAGIKSFRTQDYWISRKSLWINSLLFLHKCPQFFFNPQRQRDQDVLFQDPESLSVSVYFSAVPNTAEEGHLPPSLWNEQRAGRFRLSHLSWVVSTSSSTFPSDITLFSANFFSRSLSVEMQSENAIVSALSLY